MSNIKQRLAKVEHQRGGGVVLSPSGAPVIHVEGQGYQFNGLFHERLADLDPGVYQVLEGPEVDFALVWDHNTPWPEAIVAMQERGAEYRPITK